MVYLTTKDFANTVKEIIDDYWKLILTEKDMKCKINILFSEVENRKLALRGSKFVVTFSKILGKKRITVLIETLRSIDANLYGQIV